MRYGRLLAAAIAVMILYLLGTMEVSAVPLDTDGDGFADAVESSLGSNPADPSSTPEHATLPLTCGDGLDNDGDGLIDGADPGCGPPVIISGQSAELDFISLADNGSPGTSPFLDSFFLATTGTPSPSNFSGPALVPTISEYSINLSTGEGTVTERTVDDSFLMTITGGPGAFSLISTSDCSAASPSPFPAEVLAVLPFCVIASDPSLLAVTQLESPVGTPVPLTDPAYAGPVEFVDLAFEKDPSTTNAPARWKCTADRGSWTHAGDASVFSSVGGIAELPDVDALSQEAAESGGGSAPLYAAIAGGLSAAVLAIAAGGWYARRRWLR